MNKPEGYDDININSNGRLAPGGHRCIVIKVLEGKSSTGKEQLEIWLDMAGDDPQPSFFSNQYMNNTSETKKWPCRFWITGYETDDYGKRNLKKFHTALEDSNANFSISWGPAYASSIQGKRIGCVFREEENEWNGRISTLIKPYYFRNVMKIFDEPVPEKKTLAKTVTATGNEDFMQVSDDLGDEGLPFR